MVRSLYNAALALALVLGMGVSIASYGYADDDGIYEDGCFDVVARATTRTMRRLDRLSEAVAVHEPGGGEVNRAIRGASRSLEQFFWQVNNTCDKGQVKTGFELVRGKIRRVERALEPLKVHPEVFRQADRFHESYKELQEIVRLL